MAEPTYPFAYGSTMLTMAEYETKETVYNLHPELWSRFKALMEYGYTQGVPLGVGTGWRIQPDPPPAGFAQPGNSWHESCPVSPTSATALAIDAVLEQSWPWMEANCALYGLRTFRDVNDEPWHAQPFEIPASRSYATVLPPMQIWPLPGDEEEVDMPLTDDDVARIAKAVWDELIGDPPDEDKPARWRLRQIHGASRYYLGGWDDDWTNPKTPTLKRIDKNTKPAK